MVAPVDDVGVEVEQGLDTPSLALCTPTGTEIAVLGCQFGLGSGRLGG